jgi:hypothetical protein
MYIVSEAVHFFLHSSIFCPTMSKHWSWAYFITNGLFFEITTLSRMHGVLDASITTRTNLSNLILSAQPLAASLVASQMQNMKEKVATRFFVPVRLL